MKPLTSEEYYGLQILLMGMATRAPWTKSDKANGIHAINGRVANGLVERRLARDVPQWSAVEITDTGRALLAK